MVGNALTLIQGGDFKGHFWITGFNSATSISLDQNPANLSSYTVTIGGASTLTNGGFVFIQGGSFAHAVGGNTIYIKGPGAALGDYTATVNDLTLSVAGTKHAPLATIGYTTTRGDGGRPTIISGGALNTLLVTGNFNLVKSLHLLKVSGSFPCVGVTGAYCEFLDCIFEGGEPVRLAQGSNTLRRCEVKGSHSGNAGVAIVGTGNTTIEECEIHGNSGRGIDMGALALTHVVHCNIHGNTLDGIYFPAAQSAGAVIENNILWNNAAAGIRFDQTAAEGPFMNMNIRRNIFGKNVTYDLDYSVTDASALPGMSNWAASLLDCNAFYTTGTGRYHFIPANSGDLVLTASPFVSDTDFTLNNTAGGGALIRATPCISTLPSGNKVYSYIGSSAPQTAASTTELAEMRSLWRLLTNELDTDVVPNTEVDIWIHQGLQALNEATSYYVLTSASLVTLVAETQEYTLDSTVLNVEFVEWNGKEIPKTSVDKVRAKERDWRNQASGFPEQYAHEADKLILIPKPSAAAVAASALPTIRYVARPPSPTTDGFPQLNRQAQRISVYLAASLWSICYPDSAVAQQRAAGLQGYFQEGVKALSAVVAQRGVSR